MTAAQDHTPQARMKERLASLGLPFKEIEVYGSQIVITCWSEAAAARWATLVAKFATIRSIIRSIDENVDQSIERRSRANRHKSKAFHEVWRLFACI